MKELSKHISTFAYFYAAIYCFIEGIEGWENQEIFWSVCCYICSFFAALAVVRFQIEHLYYRYRKKR